MKYHKNLIVIFMILYDNSNIKQETMNADPNTPPTRTSKHNIRTEAPPGAPKKKSRIQKKPFQSPTACRSITFAAETNDVAASPPPTFATKRTRAERRAISPIQVVEITETPPLKRVRQSDHWVKIHTKARTRAQTAKMGSCHATVSESEDDE